MRALTLLAYVLAAPALAEDIAVTAPVTAVTLYPQGATVTRETALDLPQGRHRLILRDLPRSTPLEQIRVELSGATLGGVTARSRDVPPRDATPGPEIAAARAEVEAREADLRTARAEVEAIRLEARAAEARVGFLAGLADGDRAAGLDAAQLRDLAAMIGAETLAALQEAHAATRRAEEAALALEDLQEALERARQTLAALELEDQDRAALAIEVTAETASPGTLRVTYTTPDASWTPVYDLRLARETGQLDLTRGAFVAQSTGESWGNVAVTLSTVRPSGQLAPSELYPYGLRIYDEDQMPRPLAQQKREAFAMADAAAPMLESAITEATASFDGLAVTYRYPDPVTIATGADRVRLALGTLSLRADLRARAVPFYDSTAFLVAEITNDSGELILPTAEASFYLDGRFTGRRALDLIPAGGEADLSFGPIDGLRLTRSVLDRTGGDRGVITRSNELSETVRLEIENLTDMPWPVEVIDRVPYTEQEDLEIDWRATPAPSETDLDDQRGILAWRFDLGAGESQEITLSQTITWPDGYVLQP